MFLQREIFNNLRVKLNYKCCILIKSHRFDLEFIFTAAFCQKVQQAATVDSYKLGTLSHWWVSLRIFMTLI